MASLWHELAGSTLDEIFHSPRAGLDDATVPDAPGVYLFFLRRAVLRCYDHPGFSRSGWPAYIGVADKSLAIRLAHHRANLRTTGLGDALVVAALPTPTPEAAAYGERLAIRTFLPVFNRVVKGLGSKPQGGRRAGQTVSPFGMLHPGRNVGRGAPRITRGELERSVRTHLRCTVPAEPAWPPFPP